MDPIERKSRDNMARQLAASGNIPAEFIPAIVAIAFDSASTAITTLKDAVFAHPDCRGSVTAIGPAIGVAVARLNAMAEQLQEFATSAGLPLHQMVIQPGTIQ